MVLHLNFLVKMFHQKTQLNKIITIYTLLSARLFNPNITEKTQNARYSFELVCYCIQLTRTCPTCLSRVERLEHLFRRDASGNRSNEGSEPMASMLWIFVVDRTKYLIRQLLGNFKSGEVYHEGCAEWGQDQTRCDSELLMKGNTILLLRAFFCQLSLARVSMVISMPCGKILNQNILTNSYMVNAKHLKVYFIMILVFDAVNCLREGMYDYGVKGSENSTAIQCACALGVMYYMSKSPQSQKTTTADKLNPRCVRDTRNTVI